MITIVAIGYGVDIGWILKLSQYIYREETGSVWIRNNNTAVEVGLEDPCVGVMIQNGKKKGRDISNPNSPTVATPSLPLRY